MDDNTGLSDQELAAEGAVALPDKEVVSILDLNASPSASGTASPSPTP